MTFRVNVADFLTRYYPKITVQASSLWFWSTHHIQHCRAIDWLELGQAGLMPPSPSNLASSISPTSSTGSASFYDAGSAGNGCGNGGRKYLSSPIGGFPDVAGFEAGGSGREAGGSAGRRKTSHPVGIGGSKCQSLLSNIKKVIAPGRLGDAFE